jgi:radical SAM protein with 4Fe4S-binding SPASM domain
MSPYELERAIEIITSTQPQVVIVSGGEPLLRRDLPELLGDLKEHGQHVWLLTNGTLLTPEVCRRLVRSVNRISISLDGATAAVHDKMRGKGSFAAVLRGIRMLQDEGFDRIGIIPTIRRDNVAEIFGLDAFAKELHVSIDSRCLFAARGSAAFCRDEYEISVADLIRAAREEIRSRLRRGDDFQQASGCSQSIIDFAQPQLQRCGAGRQKLSIDVNGDLYPCQLLHEERFRLGNILDFRDLNQLICEGNARQVARFTADRIDNVDMCRCCDVRHFCGGGCVVSNVADGLPLDQCPTYCSAIQNSYRVAVWEWCSNCSKKENLVRLLDKLCQSETAVLG